MERHRLGSTGMWVSELGLGAMTFGREADEAASRAILDRYLELGGNFVDTADRYALGGSEDLLGRALGPRRDDLILATKFRFPMSDDPNSGGGSRRHVRRSVEASLRRLQTDRVELYQVHCWDPDSPLEVTLGVLDDLVREGKILAIGVSNFAGWQLARALGVSALHGWEPVRVLQAQYSLVARGAELELLPLCADQGLAVVPWSPLGGGVLTGKYRPGGRLPADSRAANGTPSAPLLQSRLVERTFAVVDEVVAVASELGRSPAQVALNWVMQQPGVVAPIVGARTPEQFDEIVGAIGWRLDDEHRRRLEGVSELALEYPYDFHRSRGLRS